jgi:hypothetical protein
MEAMKVIQVTKAAEEGPFDDPHHLHHARP